MWDLLDATDTACKQLLALARQKGIDLAPLCDHSSFVKGDRWIWLWRRKEDGIGYNMQGKISVLPGSFKDSETSFQGMWHEAGTLPDLEGAFEFVHAWLIEGAEVDLLPVPERKRSRYGIG